MTSLPMKLECASECVNRASLQIKIQSAQDVKSWVVGTMMVKADRSIKTYLLF